MIAAHGGGFLPSYADRSDHACMVGPKGCNPDMKLTKQPTEYLKQISFDSLIFAPEAICHLVAQVGAGQIVLGSEYPSPWQLQPVDHIFCFGIAQRRESRYPRSHRGKTVQFRVVARPEELSLPWSGLRTPPHRQLWTAISGVRFKRPPALHCSQAFLVNIARTGVITPTGELHDIAAPNVALAQGAIGRNRDVVVGINARNNVAGANDLEALRRAQESRQA